MASILSLKWQWPAGREPDSTCRARITKIYPDKKLFDSPSCADFIPDPLVIEAAKLDNPQQLLRIDIPKLELSGFQVSDFIELDLIGAICIAIRKCE